MTPEQRAREAAITTWNAWANGDVKFAEVAWEQHWAYAFAAHARSEVRRALEEAQERSKALEERWGYLGGAFELSREDLRALAAKYEEEK